MQAKLYSADGKEKGNVSLPDAVFAAKVNDALMHQVTVQYLANQRQGTSKVKRRDEVSGGGKKPWKQKGTGRARAGSNTSPLWVRGGKAHGPEPRNYWTKIPRSMRVVALTSALSTRATEEKIVVIDQLNVDVPKTKQVMLLLEALALNGKKNLLLIDKDQKSLYLSGRNIKQLEIKCVTDLNALDVLRSENIIFGQEGLISKLVEVVA